MTDPALHTLRLRYQRDKAALADSLLAQSATARHTRATLQRLARLADVQLQAVRRVTGLPLEVALVAVGGYGRGQLFPHSDVDVLLLLPGDGPPAALPVGTKAGGDGRSEDGRCAVDGGGSRAAADVVDIVDMPQTPLREVVEKFIGACWDAGLEIGSSVRTVAQCLAQARQDITVQTALLEARLVDGDAALLECLRSRCASMLHPREFFTAKMQELRQRHARFAHTPYALEPDCKESPGGLRDLHTILWVARAAGLGDSWQALAASGMATPLEARQLEHNEATLTHIRARLHTLAGRREDRLLFDLQARLATSLGLKDHIPPGQRMPVLASEVLMRRYYWAAKAVTQLLHILRLNLEERLFPDPTPLRRIDSRFLDKGGLLEVADDTLYHRDRHAMLETFLVWQRTPGMRGLSARTLRALFNARALMDRQFRHDPANRVTFLRILQQPSGVTRALRLMNATSVLGRYLWSFRRIVGKMQHDLLHVYTVDQHTLMVVRNMRRFFIPEHAHEYPLCSQLASGWDKPWLLYLAALFHDIGKGRGGDHSTIGAIEVRRFARQHGMQMHDAELVEFLVREHLRMSLVAQKQDTSDPAVLRAFADCVGTQRRLTALYLLTVADIRGTSPRVWNAWKAKLLQDLFHATHRLLADPRAATQDRSTIIPDPAAQVQARQQQALALLCGAPLASAPGLQDPVRQAHTAWRDLWDRLEPGYFMRHEPADIAWHARALQAHLHTTRPIVCARPSLEGEGMQVLLYTPDQSDLFARICGYFDRTGLGVLEARIHLTRTGHALDSFQLTPAQPLTHDSMPAAGDTAFALLDARLIENGLAQAITATGPLRPPLRRRPSRRVRSFPVMPSISLLPDDKACYWLLHITASDRPGLLYAIARVLSEHGLSVQLAKISTLGERAEDTFLIQGPALSHPTKRQEIEKRLAQVLQT